MRTHRLLTAIAVAMVTAPAGPAAAQQPERIDPSAACTLDQLGVLSITLGRSAGLSVTTDGDAINLVTAYSPIRASTYFYDVACTGADGASVEPTLTNTHAIAIADAQGVNTGFTLDLEDGPLVSPAGTPIPLAATLGDGRNALTINGGDLDVTLGRDRASGETRVDFSPGAQLAPDLIFSGNEAWVYVNAGDGGVHLDGRGGPGLGGPVETSDFRLAGGAGPDVLHAGARTILFGGEGNDLLIGSPETDGLYGDQGQDRLVGKGGKDFFEPDVIAAETDDDTVIGGPGDDWIYYYWAEFFGNGRQLHIDLRRKGRQETGGVGSEVLQSIENVYSSNSVVIGNDKDNVMTTDINGENPNNARSRLVGNGGDDVLKGGLESDDLLVGGAGDDRLLGAHLRRARYDVPASDTLLGGGGQDLLRANDAGRDRRIDCGPGEGPHEVAIIDPLDPAPLGCNVVRVRRGSPVE